MYNLMDLLVQVLNNSGSDLHLSSGLAPMIRKDGELLKLSEEVLSNNDILDFIINAS